MRPLFTLLIFSEIPDHVAQFALLEGDLRRFQGVLINTIPEDKKAQDLQNELGRFVYDDDVGTCKIDFMDEPPTWEGACPFDFIVTCGFIC